MTAAETTTRPSGALATKRPTVRHSPWAPWVEATIADWRERWPAVFTRPVPLAVGISGHIKAALRAEGNIFDSKTLGMSIHCWTQQSAYLRAMARGEIRRNLDGTEAGVPDDEARQNARKLLDERATRQEERARQKQERKRAMADGAGVGAVDTQLKSLDVRP
jgi:sRNA-binding protein